MDKEQRIEEILEENISCNTCKFRKRLNAEIAYQILVLFDEEEIRKEHQQKAKRIHKDLVALQLDCGNVYELSRRLEEYVSSMLSRILGNPPS